MKKNTILIYVLLFFILSSFVAFAESEIKIELTEEERQYLEDLGPITMGVDPDWLPYEHVDEEGNFTGIAADLIEIVEKRLDIEIELIITEHWDETLEKSREGEFLIIPFLNQTPAREEWLIFTEPIFTDPNVFITREEYPFIGDPADISEGTIVFPSGTSMEEFIRNDYPNLTIITTPTEIEAFEMVSNREADMTLRSLIIAAYTIRNEGFFNLKIAGQLPEYTNNLRVGVLKSEPMLRDILNKAVVSITPRERQDIINRHVYIRVEEPINYGLIIRISLGILFLILIAFYWNVKLNKLKAQAESASKAKSDFLANMSHELRTPLNAILGYARILKENPDLYKSQKKGLDVIEKSGNHLLGLINEILEIAKIEAKKMELANESFNLRDFLEGISEMIKIKALQKSINYHYKVESELPEFVEGDEKRLGQVLLNILGNAVKFTDEGSVTFKVKYHVDEITFTIIDTGIGIDKDQLEEIFLPFKQAAEHKRNQEGTGLGLAISKKIIDLMGGELSVESEKGKGSKFTFTIKLPETEDYAIENVKNKQILNYKGSRIKVLIADDKPYNRSLLKDFLEAIGFTVLEASNGKEAVEKTLIEKPDIVLMDIVMPVMNGYEATRKIREKFNPSQVVVIAISASILDEDINKSYESGMNDYLAKPIVFESLTKKIADSLKIEWVYEHKKIESNNNESKKMKANEKYECPSEDILKKLHQISISGNAKKLITEIESIYSESEPYKVFYDKILELCEELKMKKVQNILEKCMGDDSND